MRYSLFNSLLALILLTGCKVQYAPLEKATGNADCIKKFVPHFTNQLYTAYIDVTSHHLSGLLYFKAMQDSSVRIIFTSETGVKFFDFGFESDGHFKKYFILPKMDKKIVVNALKKDMELVLMKNITKRVVIFSDSTFIYYRVKADKGYVYYVTLQCQELERIERASKRRTVVVAQMQDYNNGVPSTIKITHQNFRFNILLKKVESVR
ncbi:MAG: hypothetical protein H0X33_01920 [Taibaiella sp.]|nr:hypothetical protein [Taibaiella sp.]